VYRLVQAILFEIKIDINEKPVEIYHKQDVNDCLEQSSLAISQEEQTLYG
jgi:hypothetical protein